MATSINRRSIARTVLAGFAAAAMLTLASAEETYITGVGNTTERPPESPRYMLMDLGTLGGEQSRALAMNDQATVVGWSDTGPRPYAFARQAFIRRLNEPMTALPSLGWGDTEARDINAFEQVVGVATISGKPHGIYWNEGVPYDLNDVTNMPRDLVEAPGAAIVETSACHAPLIHVLEANSINDWGEIAACGLFLGDDNVHGILLTPHEPFNPIEPFFDWVDLGELPGAEDCIAYAVNECCEVVGVSGDDAFVWSGVIEGLDNRGLVSEARSINNWGAAVGWTGTDPSRPMAAMWEGDHRFDLSPDPGTVSQANAIADNGQIVGWTAAYSPFWPYQERPRYAMLWEGCIPVFLNAETLFPGYRQWHLEQATAVDRMGYVAGYGIAPDGSERAYLLVPWDFIPGADLR